MTSSWIWSKSVVLVKRKANVWLFSMHTAIIVLRLYLAIQQIRSSLKSDPPPSSSTRLGNENYSPCSFLATLIQTESMTVTFFITSRALWTWIKRKWYEHVCPAKGASNDCTIDIMLWSPPGIPHKSPIDWRTASSSWGISPKSGHRWDWDFQSPQIPTRQHGHAVVCIHLCNAENFI